MPTSGLLAFRLRTEVALKLDMTRYGAGSRKLRKSAQTFLSIGEEPFAITAVQAPIVEHSQTPIIGQKRSALKLSKREESLLEPTGFKIVRGQTGFMRRKRDREDH